MPKFSYRACTESGDLIRGSIEAESVEAAEALIRREGYTPLAVKGRSPWMVSFVEKLSSSFVRVEPETLIVFTRQLRSLLMAGIPVVRALEVILQQMEAKRLQTVIGRLLQDLEAGLDLSSAMGKHARVFSELYVSTVMAGEIGGALPEVLERLTEYLEYTERVKRDIKSALRYPVLVFCSLAAAAFVFAIFVIPRLATVFSGFHLELPLPTRMVFGLSAFLRAHVGALCVGLLVVIGLSKAYATTARGREKLDYLKLRLPVFGRLARGIALFNFAWMLKVMYQSGLPIVRALKIVARTIQNRVYEGQVRLAIERVEAGETLSSFLRESPYFPPMTVYMIATGERSGSLDKMLDEIAKHYDMELRYKIRNMMTLIEPMVTAFLGVGVLVLALSVFLPMWDLMRKISGGY